MRVGIDIGGTFTDFYLLDVARGSSHTYKLLSTPKDPAEAVLAGLALLEGQIAATTDDTGQDPVPSAVTACRSPAIEIVHGSTVATNALLERKGARTALIATKGFRDVLAIGRQTRSQLYDLSGDRPSPLVPSHLTLEVDERIDAAGRIVRPLDLAHLQSLVAQLHELQVESVAVALLFSFLHPLHEQRIAEDLRQAGFFVSVSSEILPEFREYERTSTTAINAYVSPVLDRYLGRLADHLQNAEFRIMQSNGGSIGVERARREAVRSILSGPAGGVVGAFHVARAAGFERTITFDMGGTSTDVSLCDEEIRVTTEADIGGLPIRIPVIDIHTVGAGGGSIAWVDAGGALRVGPQSAGADPGPACYGRGGDQPTVTDAHVVLGRLPPGHFLGGRMRLDTLAAEEVLARLARDVGMPGSDDLTLAQAVALGMIQIANAHMERALRVISVERGYDPQDFTLVCFGGAGGLHACDLARRLGIGRVLIPPLAPVLSAFGMLVADVVKDYVQTVMLPATTSFEELRGLVAALESRGRAEVAAEGVADRDITLHPQIDVRYYGQSYELVVPFSPDFASEFHAAHRRAYGHDRPEAPLEIVNVRLRAVGSVSQPSLPEWEAGDPDVRPALLDRRLVVLTSGLAEASFYDGQTLRPSQSVSGPAVIVQPDTTVFLAPGDMARMDRQSNLVIAVAPLEAAFAN